MNILDAAYEVLKSAKRPMKCAELTVEMTERRFWRPGELMPSQRSVF